MGYHVFDPTALEETPDRPCVQHRIADECGFEQFSANLFTAAPGEQLPLAYHYHDDQEELFFVVDGTLHVETPDGELVVEEDHVYAVEPGSPHRAHNPADAAESVSALAVGAPRVSDAHKYEP